MSLPALNTVASPCSSTTRTAASALAWSSASARVLYMAAVMEFFLSTRFSVRVITPASVWTRMSLMGMLQYQKTYSLKYTIWWVVASRVPPVSQSWPVWSKKPLRNSCARAWPSR